MEGYRIPTIATTRHDPSRWEYGRALAARPERWRPGWLAVLADDAKAGASRRRAAPNCRRRRAGCSNSAYATIEITDSVAMMGGHQVALVRGYSGPHAAGHRRRSKATC